MLMLDANVLIYAYRSEEKQHAAARVWLEQPQVHVIETGAHFFSVLSSLLESAQIRGPLVTDTALAALAIENGATLCTTDRDFARFAGLKWLDPLR